MIMLELIISYGCISSFNLVARRGIGSGMAPGLGNGRKQGGDGISTGLSLKIWVRKRIFFDVNISIIISISISIRRDLNGPQSEERVVSRDWGLQKNLFVVNISISIMGFSLEMQTITLRDIFGFAKEYLLI